MAPSHTEQDFGKHVVASRSQARELWSLTWPAMLRNYLVCGGNTFCVALVGWWDGANVAHYDGAGLGKMYSNITGLSIGIGLSMGLATFCSQAYGAGRGNIENAVHLRRCSITLVFAFLLTTVLTVFAKQLLLLLGQPPEVAETSAYFAQVQLIGLPAVWIATAIQTVLDGIHRTRPGFYGCVVATAAQILACWVFLHPALLNWGYIGMAWSTVLSNFIQLFIMVLYVVTQGLDKEVWLSTDAEEESATFAGVLDFLIVTLPSAAMMWMEWWSFEGLTMLVGLLPNATVNLAAHSTLFNTVVVFYMTYTGLSTAVCSLVGRNIGAADSWRNRRLVVLSLGLCFSVSALVSTSLWLCRTEVAVLFTPNDRRVVEVVEQSIMGICLSIPTYGALMTLYGVCRGASLQSSAVYGTCIGYCIIGFPAAWLCGKHLGWPTPLMGVWVGNVAALVFAATWVIILVLRVDWDQISSVNGKSSDQMRDASVPLLGNQHQDEDLLALEEGQP
uniref:Protein DETOXIFICATION n=1 Tax=Tetraselmis sp. GSL018 TaxID=582737 RepID=A0A061R7J8_9CHLO|mmetsp:Transcript_24621/g.58564  ORF Transcript_24621/g.58564 Transcript_24621/m.58564 type:complete len:503 (-) Transcript_24621:218-1726(-)